MRNIIKVLLNEGIEREDVVAICKYIKEEYEVIDEIKDTTIENALEKASDNVESSTYGIFTPSKNAVEKLRKLKELAKRRADRQGKRIEVKGNEFGYTYKHVPKEENK